MLLICIELIWGLDSVVFINTILFILCVAEPWISKMYFLNFPTDPIPRKTVLIK